MTPMEMFQYGGAGLAVLALFVFIAMGMGKKVPERRMARVTNRRAISSRTAVDAMSLRRKSQSMGIPMLSKMMQNFTSLASLQFKLEQAGMKMNAEFFVTMCLGLLASVTGALLLLHKPPAVAILAGVFVGLLLPRFVVKRKVAKRLKKFLTLFPDAIDFIVRGLRSGLPVTESMNMVGREMEEPVGSMFASIGE